MARKKLDKKAEILLRILGREYKDNVSTRSEGVQIDILRLRGNDLPFDKGEINPTVEELTKMRFVVVVRGLKGAETRVILTESGWDYLNPWYKKMWSPLKGDLRTIIISAITTIVIFFLTYWLSKVFAN